MPKPDFDFFQSQIDIQINHLLMSFFTVNDKLAINEEFYGRISLNKLLTSRHVEIVENAIRFMIEEKLIAQIGDVRKNEYQLTLYGYRVRERGGWLKQFEENEAAKSLAIAQTKSTIKTGKHQRASVWITISVAVGVGIIQYCNYRLSEKADTREESQQLRELLREEKVTAPPKKAANKCIEDTSTVDVAHKDTAAKGLKPPPKTGE